jgi:hypothetical protein
VGLLAYHARDEGHAKLVKYVGNAIVEDGGDGRIAEYDFGGSVGGGIAANDGVDVGGKQAPHVWYAVNKFEGYSGGFFAAIAIAVGFEAKAAADLLDQQVVNAKQMSEGVVMNQVGEGFFRWPEESREKIPPQQLYDFAYVGYGGGWFLVKRNVAVFGN